MLKLAQTLINARLQLIADAINSAGPGAEMRFYSESPPSSTTGAPNGTLLVAVPMPHPIEETLENGVLVGKTLPETMVLESGEVGWVRVVDETGTAVFDALVGIPDAAGNPTAPVTVATTTFYAGMYLRGTSFNIAEAG